MACQTEKERSIYREKVLAFITSHVKGNVIPSERAISEVLQLNRHLVRKHLEEFVKEGLLEQVGRKRLLHQREKSTREVYGLLTGDGSQFSYVDGPHVVTGLIDRLTEEGGLVRHLSFRTEGQIATRIREQGLTAVIWVVPNIAKCSEMLSRLIERERLPIVAVSTFASSKDLSVLKHNFVTNDADGDMRMRAHFFASRSCRHILYFSMMSEHLVIFKNHLADCGITLPSDCIISHAGDLSMKLPRLLKKYPLDGILCNGCLRYYESLFEFLHGRPDFRPVLRLENHQEVRRLLSRYPDLDVAFQNEEYEQWERTLGTCAADMAMRVGRSGLLQDSEFISQKICDRKTIAFAGGER